MPELPEVESARTVIENEALGRRIVDVDDTDEYVTRPHHPGQLRQALVGRTLTVAHRRGKSMWLDTSGDGPVLGIHLGMSGKIVIADREGHETEGGDYWDRGRQAGDHRFLRFRLTFDDGGSLILIDPRRLGRVRLDPPVEALGPDAATIKPDRIRALLERSGAPVKARIMDQDRIAGIGNLLADQILWQAKIHPARPADELADDEVTRLIRALRSAVKAAIAGGGVHTLKIIPFRKKGATCPRCKKPMAMGTVGGRTTWWCTKEQVR